VCLGIGLTLFAVIRNHWVRPLEQGTFNSEESSSLDAFKDSSSHDSKSSQDLVEIIVHCKNRLTP